MNDLRTCCQQAINDGKAVRGWCSACYQRWKRAGRPAEGPPPPMSREDARQLAIASVRANAAARREDYRELRSWGEPRDQAAARIGVTWRTAGRYERVLRERVTA
ncbi:hypothetical protein [Nonomuraea wenchangensis]|uniref:Uncharacterized protein n=1 Tax=Nonomuraea wenchangensis TaxID=568860 RepID=A0A1I0F1F0_9ACTN|nr:hypothetical protein [Nonomuraea wenchangensis]SET51438.1 hypothetical protein SAMN05421811_103278 [Nonomuraea wenchangensis]